MNGRIAKLCFRSLDVKRLNYNLLVLNNCVIVTVGALKPSSLFPSIREKLGFFTLCNTRLCELILGGSFS